jgi:Domain of unknown function (DUF4956)
VKIRRLTLVSWLVLVWAASGLAAQPPFDASQPTATAETEESKARRARGDVLADTPDYETQISQVRHALIRLPFAAGLACVLALRPRRRGTPARKAPVIQTQIILAIVGALVMLVVGSSLARAFGIVGAAGLVRYRAKIEDPKDAGVMLSTLAIGLGSGVGLWLLSAFSTVFVLVILWIVESFEPRARQAFTLRVKAKDPAALKPRLEQLLGRQRVGFELRSESTDDICYEVEIPIDRGTDRLSEAILAIDGPKATGVAFEEKKEKK